MRLRSAHTGPPLDPGLLTALDVLLTERSVTRAARRLGVTPSAVSHRLRALRERLGDQLLVAAPGGLRLTARAEAIAGPLRQAILDLAAAASAGAAFDPATSTRGFTMSAVDYAEQAVLPPLVERLERLAPGVDLRIEPPSPDLGERLADGRLDLAIGPAMPLPATIVRRRLLAEGFAVAVRGSHPVLRRRWSLATYLALRHVVIAPRGSRSSIVDDALAARGEARRVALRTASFGAAPFIVAHTALCLTAPTGLLHTFAPLLGLAVRPAPLPLPSVELYAYWHARVDREHAHQWLRELLFELLAAAPTPVRPRRR